MVRDYTPVEAFEVGGVAYRDGFVTATKSITGRRPAELERTLGYAPGMLARGWWFLQLDDEVGSDEFEYGAYTQRLFDVKRGEPLALHEEMEERYSLHDLDRAWWNDRKLATAERLGRAEGADRTAKVVPIGRGGYEPGLGVPQFRLIALKRFRVVLEVPAGARMIAASPTDPNNFKVDP